MAPPNSVLAYVGPYAASLRQCKSVAFVFGACGCIAVPSTLFLGNAEHLLAIFGKKKKNWPLHLFLLNGMVINIVQEEVGKEEEPNRKG